VDLGHQEWTFRTAIAQPSHPTRQELTVTVINTTSVFDSNTTPVFSHRRRKLNMMCREVLQMLTSIIPLNKFSAIGKAHNQQPLTTFRGGVKAMTRIIRRCRMIKAKFRYLRILRRRKVLKTRS
jgi:hypothetical protein